MNTICKNHLPAMSRPSRLRAAFTLIELMMVISIIALLAALLVWGTSAAGDKKVRARVNSEMEGLKLAIDGFHKKYGFFPPGNANAALSGINPLFYELTGTTSVSAGKTTKFTDIFGDSLEGKADDISEIKTVFGVEGFVNSAVQKEAIQNFLPGLKATDWRKDELNGVKDVKTLVFPYKGAEGTFARWHYNSTSPEHNPESYDLWVEVAIGKNIVTLGNWKD